MIPLRIKYTTHAADYQTLCSFQEFRAEAQLNDEDALLQSARTPDDLLTAYADMLYAYAEKLVEDEHPEQLSNIEDDGISLALDKLIWLFAPVGWSRAAA